MEEGRAAQSEHPCIRLSPGIENSERPCTMDSYVVESGVPSYLYLTENQWDEKESQSKRLSSPCALCGRRCGAARTEGCVGVCKTGNRAVVSSFGPHFGEEPPLSGKKGSGTIFFTWCNLKCCFCQNYEIAHLGRGTEVSDEELSQLMLSVQAMGCHNVNLVTPTHVVPNIVSALRLAARQGLRIPIVYNTGGYDSLETIRVLDGIVDIYMPDMKYGDSGPAEEFSNAPDYPRVNFAAVKEMHRQVGELVTTIDGIAVRGLLVRHLVLPEGMAGTKRVAEFVSRDISKDTYMNIMAQYRPYYKAVGHPSIGRRITMTEYREALAIARAAGLRRVLSGT